eukprot:gnl/MRDRNA2_/MRDRNA2_27742_c0_seq1.p1 gnl/MRDRNA2_/MRDRNA2_27742_c0~~gnl/MRDRNA2_/MRDRNA2_27742_c0_seq1.p1  ORF type:complete len:445 (-),score=64.13 gnl/MRDRNA2_/MRDRNA2_27742_c0_seq1:33-1316(-)
MASDRYRSQRSRSRTRSRSRKRSRRRTRRRSERNDDAPHQSGLRSQCRSQGRSKSREKPKTIIESKKPKAKRGKCKAHDIAHFEWEKGMTLGPKGRYVAEKLMGDGTFGRVLGCRDTKTKETVAVKVVKGCKRYFEHAETEADILRQVMEADPEGESCVVELRDSFAYSELHYCMVFEPLGISLHEFLRENDEKGMFLSDIRKIMAQMLKCLSFLHSMGLTHTDLKCRNIMLRDSRAEEFEHPRSGGVGLRPHDRKCRIAVIDFGGATFADDHRGGRIGTRQFRSPEVILGMEWDESADMWSLGCIGSMLYTGQRLFRVHEDMEHLAACERIMDRSIPSWMGLHVSERIVEKGVEFDKQGRLVWPGTQNPETVEAVQNLDTLEQMIKARHKLFLEFLEDLLAFEPQKRLTAKDGLQHDFILEIKVHE